MAPIRSWIFVFALCVTAAAYVEASAKFYDNTYDDLDVPAILNDDEERDRYYACFMDTGPCHTEAAIFFKSIVPEALVTSCRYCTERQLSMFDKIVTWYVNNQPKQWRSLLDKILADAKAQGLSMR